MTKIGKRNRIATLIFVIAVIIAFMPFVAGQKAHAMAEFKLKQTELTFTADSDEYEAINIEDGSCSIKSCEVDDPSIISIVNHDTYVYVWPEKAGTTVLTLTGNDGKSIPVNVTVTEEAISGKVMFKTRITKCWYGTKKLKIESIEGTEGTVKVGKDTYEFTIGNSGEKTIKLKKVYPLNTKVIVTAVNGSFTKKISTKLSSWTQVNSVKAYKKNIILRVFNVHKGDIVKVTYKGRTYSKKISTDKDGKECEITFKTRNSVSKTASLKLKIVNKSKKSLFGEKAKLKDGEFDYLETGEDDPNEE